VHRHNRCMYVGEFLLGIAARLVPFALLLTIARLAQNALQPRTVSWKEAQDQFRANNLELLAGKVTIDEARADETTAFLRPNPNLTLGWDQLTPFNPDPYQPVAQSYLFRSLDKRELRLASAQKQTAITAQAQVDLERNLMFSLRHAFVRVMQAKAVVSLARENLDYYDKVLAINKDRFNAGAIARVDFDRLELQCVQYESDLATAQVNVRTAKTDLQALLRDKTPVDQFDVAEKFDFQEPLTTIEELRALAPDNRPDLRQGALAVEKAKTDHQAHNMRTTIAFSYEHGAAFLLDFLDAQSQYRSTQLSYLNMIGACLSAANQLNFAVGSEVIR
jgi:outer membrane protein, heavy metal efflux system